MDLNRSVSTHEMETLKEGIKQRYKAYHVLNRDRFPDFEYNTNRANYEPLRTSIEDELYKARGLDPASPTIHIPSTNTLALLFTDDQYIPTKKILHTCHLYATETPQVVAEPNSPWMTPPRQTHSTAPRWVWIVSAGLIVTTLFAILNVYPSIKKVLVSDLVVQFPKERQTVSRVVPIAGHAPNAEAVWVVVHPMLEGEKYYVQDPISVDEYGNWSGEILAGSPNEFTTDIAFEIRAFTNPKGKAPYEAIEEQGISIFDSWPENVDHSTEPIVIIRKPKKNL